MAIIQHLEYRFSRSYFVKCSKLYISLPHDFRFLFYLTSVLSPKRSIMSGNGLQLSSSYANEKPPSSTGSGDADLANDPASSGFFTTDFKRSVSCKLVVALVAISDLPSHLST